MTNSSAPLSPPLLRVAIICTRTANKFNECPKLQIVGIFCRSATEKPFTRGPNEPLIWITSDWWLVASGVEECNAGGHCFGSRIKNTEEQLVQGTMTGTDTDTGFPFLQRFLSCYYFLRPFNDEE